MDEKELKLQKIAQDKCDNMSEFLAPEIKLFEDEYAELFTNNTCESYIF